jgi:hypothetical protein
MDTELPPPLPNSSAATPPPLPSAAVPNAGVWRMGPLLIVHQDAEVPQDRCVKCYAATQDKFAASLAWHSETRYPGMPPPLELITRLFFSLREGRKLRLPMCSEHLRSRRRTVVVGVVTSIVGTIAGALGLYMMIRGVERRVLQQVAVLSLFLGGLAALCGCIISVIARLPVSIRHQPPTHLAIGGVSPEYLNRLPPWPPGR